MNATANAIFVQAAPDEPITGPSLRSGDPDLLESFEEQKLPIKSDILGMKHNLLRGIYLSGPPGVGKTYLVINELDDLQADYCHHQVRLSAVGCFAELKKAPWAIHVIEDLYGFLVAPGMIDLLLPALDSIDTGRPKKRTLKWTVKGMDETFDFFGAVIIISNYPITGIDKLRLQALESRLKIYELIPSQEELLALMREMSLKGMCQEALS